MNGKGSQLKPGDQVYLRSAIVEADPGGRFDEKVGDYLDSRPRVTRGTRGTILSLEEYWPQHEDLFVRGRWASPGGAEYSDWKKRVQDGSLCPVYWGTYERGQSINPEKNADMVPTSDLILAELDFLDQKTVFILKQIRVIHVDGGVTLRPHRRHKIIIIHFELENRGTEVLGIAPAVQLWLTYLDPGSTSQSLSRVDPLQIDLPQRELAAKTALSGQTFFQVPGNTGNYDFYLEFPSVGRVVKRIELSNLQPGDKVCIKRDTDNIKADNGRWDLEVSKGSISVITTFLQYKKYLGQIWLEFPRQRIDTCAGAKMRLQECYWDGCWYPIQFEKVNCSWRKHSVKKGEFVTIAATDLEKID